MTLGIIGAMDEEVRALRDALVDPAPAVVFGSPVIRGDIDGVEVLLMRSGVGKVNAALATVALAHAGATHIVFTGMAGGIGAGVHIGDAVIATDLVQHDVDVTAFGVQPGQLLSESMTWQSDPPLADQLARAFAVATANMDVSAHRGRIASGDQFIASHTRAGEIAEQFGAIAVEMEGAATAQVCTKLGVPFAVLRWISDTADDAAIEDFPLFCERIAELDLAIVRALVGAVRD
ncbi:MAG: 5'-methylthioadenosine/adenosylhomocysteine nucleosidase [Propionibacteriaceae bacterium]|jgi:adenosylhomocysteine nucleosidase|nr:5'-methylthioadenosine/adenosylhomocysteine nucleosidase [Propionibacteriaceae bacterium]